MRTRTKGETKSASWFNAPKLLGIGLADKLFVIAVEHGWRLPTLVRDVVGILAECEPVACAGVAEQISAARLQV